MRTTCQQIRWLVIVGLLGVFLGGGCSLFDQDNRMSPTSPGGSSVQRTNFFAGRGSGNKFGVAKNFGSFKVNVLTGSYRLTYTTKLGTFHLIFRAKQVALLTIGLQPDDDVIEASLQSGI